MVQPHSIPSREQVVDTMTGLTRLSNLHRAIVAGSDSLARHQIEHFTSVYATPGDLIRLLVRLFSSSKFY